MPSAFSDKLPNDLSAIASDSNSIEKTLYNLGRTIMGRRLKKAFIKYILGFEGHQK
jgi:hypothetical protein